MTLILKLDLDIVMTYFCIKNEVNRSIGSKVIIWKQRQTDRQTDMCETFTYPLSRAVKKRLNNFLGDRTFRSETDWYPGGDDVGISSRW